MMVDRPIPTDHSFLEGCIQNYLSKNFDLLWVGPSSNKYVVKGLIPLRSRGRFGLYSQFFFRVPSLLRLIVRERIKVVFVRNDPVFALFAIILRLFLPLKVIYQLSHLKEEQVLQKWDGEYLFSRFSRSLACLSRLVRNWTITRADLFIPISTSMLNELASVRCRSVKVMGLGFDPKEFQIAGVGLNFRYIVYVGTLDPIRCFELTLRGFTRYVAETGDRNLKLVIVGGKKTDKDRTRCEHFTRSLPASDQVLFFDQMPRLEMLGILKGALAGLSVIPPVGINKTISPTKLFEYIGAGIPIIASNGIPAQDEVASNYIKCYSANNEGEIAEAINKCVSIAGSSEKIPEQVLLKYSYEKMASDLSDYIIGEIGR
jgi:glycosyltransferase involved in cell wall biosynthesis